MPVYFERRLPYILTTGLIARELKASITLSISLFSLKRLPINLHTHTSLKFWLVWASNQKIRNVEPIMIYDDKYRNRKKIVET